MFKVVCSLLIHIRKLSKVLVILDKVSREFDGQYSTAELNSFLKVTNQTNSQIITVSVTTGNKSESDKIVNKISKVFAHDMPKIMSVDNVTILSSAHDNAVKYLQ